MWVYRIVAREAIRTAKRDTDGERITDGTEHDDADMRIDVLRALASLPAQLRAVVVLHYYADLTSTEIGRALRIPGATVRFRLAVARKRLGRLLDSNERVSIVPEVC